MNIDEIKSEFDKIGEKAYRATQVFNWLSSGIPDFDLMLNLPLKLRERLKEDYFIPDVEICEKLVSAIDGTVKYLFRLYDGEYIESVVMKYEHGYTICISTQVGCRMGCSFCASGLNGVSRNLLPSEMLAQVIKANIDNNIFALCYSFTFFKSYQYVFEIRVPYPRHRWVFGTKYSVAKYLPQVVCQ